FGANLRPAVRIQLAQLSRRLDAFAAAQAQLACEGWKIEHVEKQVHVTIDIDDRPFQLVGKMDRIDRHEEFGVRILDYKTADVKTTPRQTHRATGDSNIAWADLQLPLYRALAEEMGLSGRIELGYFNLPRKAQDTAVDEAG